MKGEIKVTLSDGHIWEQGEAVYFYELFYFDSKINAKLYKEIPNDIEWLGNDEYDFHLECGVFNKKYAIGMGQMVVKKYYSSYVNAVIGLRQEMNEMYRKIMAQFLVEMKRLISSANGNHEKMTFIYEDELTEFSDEDIEMLRLSWN